MTNEVIKLHTKSPILEEHLGFQGCKATRREMSVIALPLELSHQLPSGGVCEAMTTQTSTAPSHHGFVRAFTSSFGRMDAVQLCHEQCTCSGFLSSLIRKCTARCLLQSLMKCPYQSSGTSYATLNMPQVMSSIFILEVSVLLLPGPQKP